MPRPNHYQTGDQNLVRQINLSAVMRHLRENGRLSRAALAEITGLNKTTVSSLVGELIERRFVREVGLEQVGTGRPGMMLAFNPAAGCIISGEIGVDFISVLCTDFAPQILWRCQERIDPEMGQQAIVDRSLSLLHRAIDAGSKSCHTVLGLAIGVPGLVDQATGTLLFAPNLGWENVPLGTLLQESFQAPVSVGNEANMAALGEHYFGAAQGYREVLYISAGVGLGGGIVHDGHVFTGVTGVAGEFGHMTMDPGGEPCNCGNRGCWETQVSQRALFRHVRQGMASGRTSKLSEMAGGDLAQLTVPMVVEAARSGDAVAREALDRVGRDLGIGIASLVNALNPELVVFGGILSLAWEFLHPVVQEELQRRVLRWNREAIQVVLAQHGSDACVMGCVAQVLQAILSEPQRVS
jgi:glucokinase-like ROK family protein